MLQFVVKLGLYIIALMLTYDMTQHAKRYGTLEHVRERKRILEKMIAEMPENHVQTTFICRKCLNVFTYEDTQPIAIAQLGKFVYANGICAECARRESGLAQQAQY